MQKIIIKKTMKLIKRKKHLCKICKSAVTIENRLLLDDQVYHARCYRLQNSTANLSKTAKNEISNEFSDDDNDEYNNQYNNEDEEDDNYNENDNCSSLKSKISNENE